MSSTPMQTRYVPILRHKPSVLLLLLLVIFLFNGCERQSTVLLNLRSTVENVEERQELSLTFSLSQESGQVQVLLSASDEKSSWSLAIEPDTSGAYTIGPVTMGDYIGLPEGVWTLAVMLDDGQWLEESITVQQP